MRASSISEITYTYLQRSCLPPLMAACQRLADHCPKVQKGEQHARFPRGEPDRDTYRRSAVPPELKEAEAGTGSATEFSLEVTLVDGDGQPPQ